jgi:hypothetical protein
MIRLYSVYVSSFSEDTMNLHIDVAPSIADMPEEEIREILKKTMRESLELLDSVDIEKE